MPNHDGTPEGAFGGYGPCEPYWATLPCAVPADIPATQVDLAKQAAAWHIFVATGRKYTGRCTFKEYACSAGCAGDVYSALGYSFPDELFAVPAQLPSGDLLTVWQCGCNAASVGCQCDNPPYVQLSRAPIREITSVVIGGITLPPTAYTVRGQRLYRTDGGAWPVCQPVDRTSGQAWYIEYAWGFDLPPALLLHGASYAVELAKRACGQPCKLPDANGIVLSTTTATYQSRNLLWEGEYMLTGYTPLDSAILADRGGTKRALDRPRYRSV